MLLCDVIVKSIYMAFICCQINIFGVFKLSHTKTRDMKMLPWALLKIVLIFCYLMNSESKKICKLVNNEFLLYSCSPIKDQDLQ